MSAAFTPGPWAAFTDDSGRRPHTNIIGYRPRTNVVFSLPGHHKDDANVRLICAAPELLELAAKLAAMCDGLNNGNSSAEHEACKLAEQAKALVAKATGGAA